MCTYSWACVTFEAMTIMIWVDTCLLIGLIVFIALEFSTVVLTRAKNRAGSCDKMQRGKKFISPNR